MCYFCYRNSFPNGICSQCNQSKKIHAKGLCSNCYSKKLHSEDKEHYKQYVKNWYQKNLLKERGRARRNMKSPKGKARQLRYATQKKIAYFEYMEKHKPSCIRCGYSEFKRALSFHHLDPTTKSFELSYGEWRKSKINDVEAKFDLERQKCIVLCMNCHMGLESKLWSINSILLSA